MEVLTRQLHATAVPKGHLLHSGTDAGPDQQVRLFFKSGLAKDQLPVIKNFTQTNFRSIGGGLMISGNVTGNQNEITLQTSEGATKVSLAVHERHLFKGMNSSVSFRNGEPVDDVIDWLRYHAEHHELQAVLLIDRSGPVADANLVLAIAKAEIDGLERVVVLNFDVPLGKSGTGPEGHPFNAPDAPGKDRMEIPEPEPWSAPLGENIMFELLRHTYLDDARAVMNLETTDLLEITDGPNVFDLTVSAPHGYTPLVGERIYPWSVRKNKTPKFGDHICRRFDGSLGNLRWCISPKILGIDTIWRLVRVVGANAEGAEAQKYFKCVAMRLPNYKTAQIVPKSSLIEDVKLIKLAKKVFGHKPVRAPQDVSSEIKKKTGHRTCIITTMKNEGPFILEWIAYHRAIGVQDFIVYTNDCTDGTEAMLKLLDGHGIVQHRENPFRNSDLKPQHAALRAGEDEPIIKNADWVVCMDVDEFINIRAGNGHLKDLYKAVGVANMISMTWRLFGNADIHEYKDELLIEQFDRCAPELSRKPHQAWGFKTLFRHIGLFKKLGVHRPKGLKPQLLDEIKWVNGSGIPLPQAMYRNAWRSTSETYGYDLVTLNHYAVRSAESFLVKRDRGRVNHVDRDQGLAYWFRMNNNAENDTSIQRMVPAVQAELDDLAKLEGIAAAHTYSVAKHREKIDELRATENHQNFYEELTGDRMQRMARLHTHFGSSVFFSGPQVVPDEVVMKDPEDDFFFAVEVDISATQT